MPKLMLIRHGVSRWGGENRFTGWADPPLGSLGEREAMVAARMVARSGVRFDAGFTSRLRRAEQTLEILIRELGLHDLPIVRDWRLNERHYGTLQGEHRMASVKRYGNRSVVAWRRAYDAYPPPLETDDPRWAEQLARIPEVPESLQPRSESLAVAAARAVPVWETRIAPLLRLGCSVLVVAHTSPIRALVRAIEDLGDDESAAFRISTAVPRLYELDHALRIVSRGDLFEGVTQSFRYWRDQAKPRWLSWA
jgi:2,3-bisphosphoglycerate-dependent phosphoglycerate mutase